MKVYVFEGGGGYFFLGYPNEPTFHERTRLNINRRKLADEWRSVSFGWDRTVKPKPKKGRPDVCLGCGGLLVSATAVGFREIRTIPSFERIGMDWSKLADDNFDRFDALRDGAYGEHAFHQIGGYPANIQDDTMEEECQRAAEYVFRRPDLDPAGWRLLLQVGSDEALGMM